MSNFFDDLTWTCHVCKEERPDTQISVYTMHGVSDWSVNVRFCNDRQACIQGAPGVAKEMAAPLLKLDEKRARG